MFRLPMLVGFLFVAIAVRAQESPAIPIEKDIVYATVDGVDLHLDIARPREGEGPFPLVVFLHGGGFTAGDKANNHGHIRRMAAAGFVGTTVQYRFAPKYPMPAQAEDAQCAIRFLRSRASEFQIDPERIAAVGDSAGGALALLMGLMDEESPINAECGHGDQPFKVQAVVNYYGATDMTVPRPPATPEMEAEVRRFYGKSSEDVRRGMFGTLDRSDPVFKKCSPVTYVDAGDPPVLTFHGTADQFVAVEQAKLLHAALEQAGVENELVIYEGAGHGWSGALREDSNRQMTEFLRHYLMK
jgi:acetyl esterase/lipase